MATGTFYAVAMSSNASAWRTVVGWCVMGFAHYNTHDEVARVIGALKELALRGPAA